MKIKMKFLGAAGNVTGSCTMVEVNGSRILIDCGYTQERDLQGRNWEPFAVPPKSIDAVLLTHAHLDHCGLLPKLVKEGFKGTIYATAPTCDIAKYVLLDAAHIQVEDAKFKNKRHKKEGRAEKEPAKPLYDVEDANATLPLFKPVRTGRNVTVAENIEARFDFGGHILGASFITVAITAGDETRTIMFSGDIGRNNRPILQDPQSPEGADYVLCESTYGDSVHEDASDTEDRLVEIISQARAKGGNVVIPSFAIERSQELLYYLDRLFTAKRLPPMTVFLDSPMAIGVTELFEKYADQLDEDVRTQIKNHDSPFSFPTLVTTRTATQSKSINEIRGTAIIIAGSGMCTGGRIKHHLLTNIPRPECTILFVGYQARGTLGRQIIEMDEGGAENAEVRILGQMVPVRATIERIRGFSAHADREEMYAWLKGLKRSPKRIFIVHGEPETAKAFGAFLTERTAWPTTIAEYQQEVILD